MNIYFKKITRFIIGLILMMSNSAMSFSQDYNLPAIRDSLNFYFKSIATERSDNKKLQLNENILRIIRESLSKKAAFDNPVDSVMNMGVIKSPNNLLRIYSWNIAFNNGTHKYFGFIHYYNKKEKQAQLFELNDCSEDIKNPEYLKLSNKEWYGSLIYKIIENQNKGKVYYTLLLSDLNDLLTKKKIIDVLHFDDTDSPVFGSRIFNNLPRNTRVIFEYNARANMTLTYDETTEMIVYDHLSPSKPSLVGVYEFYGPDFSYDGYKFEKGMWILHTDIDARNNKQ